MLTLPGMGSPAPFRSDLHWIMSFSRFHFVDTCSTDNGITSSAGMIGRFVLMLIQERWQGVATREATLLFYAQPKQL
jgi:hypothetical protein